MQDYLNNRGKLREPFEPFKSWDGSLKDARRHEWPWVLPADAYMAYHSVRLLMLGAGGFRLRCMLCKSWDVQTLLLLTAFGGRRGRICCLAGSRRRSPARCIQSNGIA
jgi:hypothetical protein